MRKFATRHVVRLLELLFRINPADHCSSYVYNFLHEEWKFFQIDRPLKFLAVNKENFVLGDYGKSPRHAILWSWTNGLREFTFPRTTARERDERAADIVFPHPSDHDTFFFVYVKSQRPWGAYPPVVVDELKGVQLVKTYTFDLSGNNPSDLDTRQLLDLRSQLDFLDTLSLQIDAVDFKFSSKLPRSALGSFAIAKWEIFWVEPGYNIYLRFNALSRRFFVRYAIRGSPERDDDELEDLGLDDSFSHLSYVWDNDSVFVTQTETPREFELVTVPMWNTSSACLERGPGNITSRRRFSIPTLWGDKDTSPRFMELHCDGDVKMMVTEKGLYVAEV